MFIFFVHFDLIQHSAHTISSDLLFGSSLCVDFGFFIDSMTLNSTLRWCKNVDSVSRGFYALRFTYSKSFPRQDAFLVTDF